MKEPAGGRSRSHTRRGVPATRPPDGATPPAPFALITGASQGLGRALAEASARRGRNLALVALPASGLPEAAAALAASYPIRVEHLEADLTADRGVQRVQAWLARCRIPVDTLINNAGISHHGPAGITAGKAILFRSSLAIPSPHQAHYIPHILVSGGASPS